MLMGGRQQYSADAVHAVQVVDARASVVDVERRDAQPGAGQQIAAGRWEPGTRRPDRTASRKAFVSPARRLGPDRSTCKSIPSADGRSAAELVRGFDMELDSTPVPLDA
jgi:hypothetical protein